MKSIFRIFLTAAVALSTIPAHAEVSLQIDPDVVRASQISVNRVYGEVRKATDCDSTHTCSKAIAMISGKTLAVGAVMTGVGMAGIAYGHGGINELFFRGIGHELMLSIIGTNAILMRAGLATIMAATVVLLASSVVFTLYPTSAGAANLEDGFLSNQESFEIFMNLSPEQQAGILKMSPKLQALFVTVASQVIESTKN